MSGAPGRIRFGPFEADSSAGELRNNGRLIRLQEQPFQVLIALLERPGDVVTREELRERLWPGDSFGDFDQGLNTAINKLREALGDSAANPKFIETLPKRGYRFVHALESEAAPPATPAPPARVPGVRLPVYVIAAAAFIVVAALVGIFWIRRESPPPQLPLRRFSISPSIPVATRAFFDPVAAVSPNGRHIAYITDEGENRLWIHELHRGSARAIEGTDGARRPFWSPDSEYVAFVAAGEIRKAPARGGSIAILCQDCAGEFFGGTWSPDGRSIVFADGGPSSLYEIPASGGSRRLLLSAQQLRNRQGSAKDPKALGYLSSPQFLPAGPGRRVIVFSLGYASATLIVRDLATGQEEALGPGNNPVYSPTGHLLYRGGSGPLDIWARPFSLESLRATGEAFQVAKGASDATIAEDGTLVYLDSNSHALAWLDRKRTAAGSVGQPLELFAYPALSPNGRFLAIETMENGNLDLWVYDLERGTRTRLTNHPATDILPVWSPTGEEIAFSSYRSGNIDVFLQRADGGAEERAIVAGPKNERVTDWSRDGRYILYSVLDPKNRHDIWYLRRSEKGEWEQAPFLQTASNEIAPKLSPDGRYIAYLSDESGQYEVYVRPFPSGSRKWPISTRGGTQVRWRRDGRELFYTEAGTLIAVPVEIGSEFNPGSPSRLFSHPGFQFWPEPNYEVSLDGQRFLVPERLGGKERKIHVVQNWFAEFRN
jgi:Tol biopolymer transport system component/DNA-binding winged helix-turn-helix (wHTH) protein